MDTVESLSRQIAVAGDLHSVVTTMKALSSAGIREFERSVHSLVQSVRVLQYGFQVLLMNHPELIPDETGHTHQHTLAVVFGTDHGLCGPINRLMAGYALDRLHAHEQNSVAAVGARISQQFEIAGVSPLATFSLPTSVGAIPQLVRTMLVWLNRQREDAEVDRVVVYHSRPSGRGGYEPRTSILIPLDRSLLRAISRRDWPSRRIPMHTLEPRTLLQRLTEESLSYSLYRAFAEARASEHIGRLATMYAAEQAIEERLSDLRLRYNRERQQAISTELLDVIAGFEAVQGQRRI